MRLEYFDDLSLPRPVLLLYGDRGFDPGEVVLLRRAIQELADGATALQGYTACAKAKASHPRTCVGRVLGALDSRTYFQSRIWPTYPALPVVGRKLRSAGLALSTAGDQVGATKLTQPVLVWCGAIGCS
jgi:hypothetical protein